MKMIGKGIIGLTINFYIISQAAIHTINNYIVNSQCVLDTNTDLNLLSSTNSNKTSLIWLPSHCNHLGNEIADSMQKEVPTSLMMDLNLFYQSQDTIFKTLLGNGEKKKDQKRWKSTNDDYTETILMLPKIKNNSWKLLRAEIEEEL